MLIHRLGATLLIMASFSGCSGRDPGEGADPESGQVPAAPLAEDSAEELGQLPAGSRATLVDGNDPEVSGAFLLPKDPESDSEDQYGQFLGAGVIVRVVEDPGSLDRSRADIDRDLGLSDDPEEIEELRREEPQSYTPPHWRSGHRPVRVVVESGRHQGTAGAVMRMYLRPLD